jgi:type IV pilus assembly protein PilE
MKSMRIRKYTHGMTLMELMIVVVIIGILAAIAYPNYRDAAARAKRNEAKAALLAIATNQERFYLQNNTYTTDLPSVNATAITDSGTYAITIPVANANNFTAVATYLNADNEATKCLTFQIDGRGAKASAPLLDCWTRTR